MEHRHLSSDMRSVSPAQAVESDVRSLISKIHTFEETGRLSANISAQHFQKADWVAYSPQPLFLPSIDDPHPLFLPSIDDGSMGLSKLSIPVQISDFAPDEDQRIAAQASLASPELLKYYFDTKNFN